jgi:predicted MFS family arabinose efflux permease
MIGLPAVTAYVITSVEDKRKLTSVLSLVWSTYSLSYIFAPTVGGYFATMIGMRWVLRVAAVLAAVATAIFFLLHSQHPRKTEEAHDERLPKAEEGKLLQKIILWTLFLALASFFISIGRPYVQTFLSESIKMSEIQVGLFGSIYYAGITFIGIAMGRVGDRWRKSGAMAVCLLLYVAAIVPLFFVTETTTLMITAFILGGSAILGSFVSSFVGTIAPRAKRGLWVSIPQTFSAIASLIAPYLGGYLYTFSPTYAFLISVSAVPFLAVYAIVKLKD